MTGYPWIDANMRRLKREGWLHHLARHSVACFATRGDLWLPWPRVAKHFDYELIDGDFALNNGNWHWLSASAFFHQYGRVYSPVAFAKKYGDEAIAYIRRYVPEIADLPDKYILEPWKAPQHLQQQIGLGETYPRPIVDHDSARKENLDRMAAAYKDPARKARCTTTVPFSRQFEDFE